MFGCFTWIFYSENEKNKLNLFSNGDAWRKHISEAFFQILIEYTF